MFHLILHNIRSAHNVGAILRTADALNAKDVYLTGYTPSPIDQFDRPNKAVAKTALGAEKSLAWKKVKNVNQVLARLKKQKVTVIAVEQDEKAIDYKEMAKKLGKSWAKKQNVAIILGNEVTGLPQTILQKSDHIIEVKMRGKKESLNVSVAAGIVLYRLFD